MKNVLIPISITIHLLIEFSYLVMARYGYNSNYTDRVYFYADPFCIALLLLSISIVTSPTFLDWQFIYAYIVVNALRGCCYVLKDKHLIERNDYLTIVLIGTALATVIITLSAWRHGHFKDEN